VGRLAAYLAKNYRPPQNSTKRHVLSSKLFGQMSVVWKERFVTANDEARHRQHAFASQPRVCNFSSLITKTLQRFTSIFETKTLPHVCAFESSHLNFLSKQGPVQRSMMSWTPTNDTCLGTEARADDRYATPTAVAASPARLTDFMVLASAAEAVLTTKLTLYGASSPPEKKLGIEVRMRREV
jgi:hypothetical protein